MLQKHIGCFKNAGKLEVVEKTPEDWALAKKLNETARGVYEPNDFLHAIIAKRHGAIFVSNDRQFRSEAERIAETVSLREFLRLKLQPG